MFFWGLSSSVVQEVTFSFWILNDYRCFRGKFYHCNDSSVRSKGECTGFNNQTNPYTDDCTFPSCTFGIHRARVVEEIAFFFQLLCACFTKSNEYRCFWGKFYHFHDSSVGSKADCTWFYNRTNPFIEDCAWTFVFDLVKNVCAIWEWPYEILHIVFGRLRFLISRFLLSGCEIEVRCVCSQNRGKCSDQILLTFSEYCLPLANWFFTDHKTMQTSKRLHLHFMWFDTALVYGAHSMYFDVLNTHGGGVCLYLCLMFSIVTSVPREWMNARANFDNIGNAMITIFSVRVFIRIRLFSVQQFWALHLVTAALA